MKHLVTVIVFILLFSCNNTVSTTNNSNQHTTDSTNKLAATDTSKIKPANKTSSLPIPKHAPGDTLTLGFGCYYKLDDKYAETEDTAQVNSWLRKKLAKVEFFGAWSNLFSNAGGGPNGAEWNSSTDLFCIATINKVLTNEQITIKLNKSEIRGISVFKYIPDGRTGTIIYFKLPKILWEKRLRNITAADYAGLYKDENIDTLKKYSSAPLNAGKIFEITLSVQMGKSNSIVLDDFFHIAYGE
jgi:hypothetical protein